MGGAPGIASADRRVNCTDYEVFAFGLDADGENIEVRRLSEVIRGPEAEELQLASEAKAFESVVVEAFAVEYTAPA